MINFKEILKDNKCEICDSKSINTVLSFNPSPLGDIYLPSDKKHLANKLYPLDLYSCAKCGYLSLIDKVNPKLSYTNYIYESKTTVGLLSHYDRYAREISKRLKLTDKDKILDVGSNDGSMLSSFKKEGLFTLGIEPASEIAKIANNSGLKTINGYLNNKTSSYILKKYGTFNVITANYVFANILDLNSFVKNIYKLLSKNGSFVIQTGYHPKQFEKNMFDYVYHEHFSYFSLNTLIFLMSKYKLKLIDVDTNSKKGGSIRVIFSKNQKSKKNKQKIDKVINYEKRLKINSSKYFMNFEKRLVRLKTKSQNELEKIKYKKKRIVGLGASHSVSTLTHHFKLNNFFDYLVDDNKKKHGLYSPGSNLIVRPVKFGKKIPNYIYVLAWQHQKTILKRYQYLKKRGIKFIIPLPKFKII
jgi:SAM-dependent methyltransferase